ncbi:MAG: tetratricopeptide repeat protein [Coleofasciculaceae cyanobacterium RL_1_1]|nr:tetratricopeptide repeat protein [Coleofasciculaceae cyanobacterium RL_1_1]
MDTNLAISYLIILIVLLLGSGIFIVRQVLRTRRVETTLSRLQQSATGGEASAKEYYELGSLLIDKKLFSRAIVQLQRALKADDLEGDENIALVYNALGFAYAAQEQYDLAIRQYKDAIKLQPQYVTALNNLGFVYERKMLVEKAIEVYEDALRYDTNNTTAKKRLESLRRRIPA